jgi:hypothetical protein
MQTSENINEIAAAMLAAQAEMQHPKKTSTAQYGDFADLVSTIDAVKPVFNKHGLVLVQSTGGVVRDGHQVATITTRVMHPASGQWIADTVEELIEPNGRNSMSQMMGIADSYHRRYQLYAIACVQGEHEDDGDGNAPSKPANNTGPRSGQDFI